MIPLARAAGAWASPPRIFTRIRGPWSPGATTGVRDTSCPVTARACVSITYRRINNSEVTAPDLESRPGRRLDRYPLRSLPGAPPQARGRRRLLRPRHRVGGSLSSGASPPPQAVAEQAGDFDRNFPRTLRVACSNDCTRSTIAVGSLRQRSLRPSGFDTVPDSKYRPLTAALGPYGRPL